MRQLPPTLLSTDLNSIIMIFCTEVKSLFISSFPSSSIPFSSSREKGRKKKNSKKGKARVMYDKPEYIVEHTQEIIHHPVKKPVNHGNFSRFPTIMRWYHFQISKCGHHGHGKRHARPAPANSPEKNRNSKNRIKNSKRRSQSPGFKHRGYASPSVMKK